MKPQTIFNKVARHLLKQMQQSKGSVYCMYRGPKGLRCAVGAVIPNRLYRSHMENAGSIDHLFDQNTKLAELLGGENISLLRRLQLIHDSHVPSVWRGELVHLAKCRNFSTKAITD